MVMQERMDGSNRVINDDFLKVSKSIPDESIDLIVADPPYNVGKDYGNNSDKMEKEEYLGFTRAWLKEAYRVLKTGGTIYTFGGKQYIPYIYSKLEQQGFSFISWIVWHYTQGQGRRRGLSSRHDDILMFSKGKEYTFNLDDIRIPQKYYRKRNNMRGANPGDVWSLPHVHYCEPGRTKHPTQKPHALYERMILASSNEQEIVLDPFAGSGSSLVVAQRTNRKFIGVEIEEQYCELIESELERNYQYFNSYFSEILRIPNDFRDEDILVEYLQNHYRWFLEKYHSNLKEDFEKNIVEKYGESVLLKYRLRELQ